MSLFSNSLSRLRYWTEIALGRVPPANEGQKRYRRIIHSTVAATAARGLNLFVGFISVPLAVGYLGRERYGVWITISSLLAFLSFTDFGLGSSLLNALATAHGRDDRREAQRYVASAFWLLATMAIVLWLPFAGASHWIAAQLFSGNGTSSLLSEAAPAVFIAITIFFLNFPLTLFAQVLSAHQQNAIVNICAMITAIMSLIAIIIVVSCKAGLIWLVLSYSGCGLLVNLISSIWLFGYAKPWLKPSIRAVDSTIARKLLGTGWMFLAVSVFWMINSQTDNLIISHFLGPGAVTPYSIAFRLFSYTVVFQSFAAFALWPAYAEARARNDFQWIRSAFRANVLFSLVSSVPLAILFIIFGQQIIRLWAGEAAVPQFQLLVWMAVWNLLMASLSTATCLLNAFGRLTGMTIYGSVTAIANIVLSIILVQRWGVNGVVFASIVCVGLFSYLPTLLEARLALRKVE
jgi:O-antigen/teichoic acid export membrane protein